MAKLPWVEHQELLLSLVQTLNSTLVLSQVLEQVLASVMRITRAERGFLLLAEADETDRYPQVAGLYLRVGRKRDGSAMTDTTGVSSSVVRKAIAEGQTVATGNAVEDPALGSAKSVILMDLRTIVCLPLLSPRSIPDQSGAAPRALGALYVDNPDTSAPFPPTACGPPRPSSATPPWRSRTPSSSSGSSAPSRSCGSPRSASSSPRSSPP